MFEKLGLLMACCDNSTQSLVNVDLTYEKN